MTIAFFKSPRLCAALFVLSVPASYFAIWIGAIIKSGGVAGWLEPFLIFRLLSYGFILTLGMFLFRRFAFQKSVSILRVIVIGFLAPLTLYMVMTLYDSAIFPIVFEGSFLSHLPQRIEIYLARFYILGVIAATISGLLYHIAIQAELQRKMSSSFS